MSDSLVDPEPAADGPSCALLRVSGLSFGYPQQVLFNAFGTQIPAGVTLLLGADGSGKTTLLRLLAGELAAPAGTLELMGLCARAQPQAYRDQVFWQDPRSTEHDARTALEVLARLRARYPRFLPTDSVALQDLLDGLGLAGHLGKPLHTLSSGTRRKLWLAGAFAAGAALTLLDEPFAGLDKPSTRFVEQQLAVLARQRQRAWVLAHYEAPAGVPLACVIDLDTLRS